jgi:hypothetical protein
MSKDVDMVLQPSEKVVPAKIAAAPVEPKGRIQVPVKIFCAKRPIAMAMLQDIIMIAGAHNDVANGKANEEQIKKLAKNTHVFLVEVGDRLMVDCGLTEKDIAIITKKISTSFEKMSEPAK